MPEVIDVPSKYKKHWQYKIYDNEEVEPPHLTIRGPGGDVWRWGLRDRDFLPDPPPPYESDIPKEIKKDLPNKWAEMAYKWNKLHPHNPVDMTDEEIREALNSIGVDADSVEEELKSFKEMIEKNRLFK